MSCLLFRLRLRWLVLESAFPLRFRDMLASGSMSCVLAALILVLCAIDASRSHTSKCIHQSYTPDSKVQSADRDHILLDSTARIERTTHILSSHHLIIPGFAHIRIGPPGVFSSPSSISRCSAVIRYYFFFVWEQTSLFMLYIPINQSVSPRSTLFVSVIFINMVNHAKGHSKSEL